MKKFVLAALLCGLACHAYAQGLPRDCSDGVHNKQRDREGKRGRGNGAGTSGKPHGRKREVSGHIPAGNRQAP